MSTTETFSSNKFTQSALSQTPKCITSRIASLLPGLTDVLHDLNLASHLVAHSHECTPTATPVTHPKLHSSPSLPNYQIAAGWRAVTTTHPLALSSTLSDMLSYRLCSFYRVDINALASTSPSLLLTHIAKPISPHDPDVDAICSLAKHLIPSLRVVITANCRTLEQVFQLHRDVSIALDRREIAVHPVARAQGRLESIRAFTHTAFQNSKRKPPRLAVVQWADPLYLAGDWVPGVVAVAGARGDGVTREGGPSVAVDIRHLRNVDAVVFGVCAVDLAGCRNIASEFWKRASPCLKGWKGRVVVTDATRLFSRVAVGTVTQSAEVLAEILLEHNIFGHMGILWEDWRTTREQERYSGEQPML